MSNLPNKEIQNKEKKVLGRVVFYSLVLLVVLVCGFQIYKANKPVSSLFATTTATDNVAIYAGPNVNYGVLGHLKENSKITVTGRYGDVWVVINFNGQQGWVQEFFLDIDGNISSLPEISYIPVATPTTVSRKQAIMVFLQAVINDSRYDPNLNVLHKYIDSLQVNYSDSVITYLLNNAPDKPNDSAKLASELIVASALFSNAGEASDWVLTKIQLYYGGEQTKIQLYVSGHENIIAVAKNQVNVFDVLQGGENLDYAPDTSSAPCGCIYNQVSCSEFSSQLDAQACYDYCQPTFGDELDANKDGQACEEYFLPTGEVLSSETLVPLSEQLLCQDIYNNLVGKFVECKIPKAHCSYQPAASGSPTFCNDAPYPNHNFALVVWDADWSDLDGQCIIVSGNVLLFDEKPQIVVTSRSQVMSCE